MYLIMHMVNDETLHSSGGYVEGFSTRQMLGAYLLLVAYSS